MKKQILILVMAIFALGISKSYSQPGLAPRPVDPICLPSDALHPITGKPYDYTIVVPAPAGTKEYTWLVTQSQNFMAATVETTAGSILSAAGTGYNDPLTGVATLKLTWQSFVYDPAKPVFVVIKVKNTVPGACSIDNLKVFKILPVNAFTLDIANIASDKTTVAAPETSINVCLPNVVSATYSITAPEGVVYDFGVSYLYYIVAAANYSTSWLPSLTIAGIDANETVTAVQWFRPSDATFATPGAMTFAAGIYTATNPVLALAPSKSVDAAGEDIIIRVTIDHKNGLIKYQGLTDETITVAVDGKTNLGALLPADQLGDVHFSSTIGSGTAAADCGKVDGFRNDLAVQVLKARPDITAPAMPAPGLLPVQ